MGNSECIHQKALLRFHREPRIMYVEKELQVPRNCQEKLDQITRLFTLGAKPKKALAELAKNLQLLNCDASPAEFFQTPNIQIAELSRRHSRSHCMTRQTQGPPKKEPSQHCSKCLPDRQFTPWEHLSKKKRETRSP